MSSRKAAPEGDGTRRHESLFLSLCRVMNALQPGIIPKINTTGGQFKKMENIVMFQNAAKQWGVPEIDVFQTVDLWEKRNIPQVSQCILALGRAVSCLRQCLQAVLLLYYVFALCPGL